MRRIEGSVIQMGHTGRYVNPLDLKVDDIDIGDIAHHLANQCRFSGATYAPYSVAQHAVLVTRFLRDAGESLDTQFVGLMHDASEAYLQDVARPLKEDPYFGKAYRGAENRAEKVVAEAFGYELPFPEIIKVADMILLATERRDLMPYPDESEWAVLDGVVPMEDGIQPWTFRRAKSNFLDEFARTAPEHILEATAVVA